MNEYISVVFTFFRIGWLLDYELLWLAVELEILILILFCFVIFFSSISSVYCLFQNI